jgi:hypothetical protein
MISSYRLGDLVLLNLNNDEKGEILRDFPKSIGSKYILEKRNGGSHTNIDIITKIVVECIKQKSDVLPKDIADSTLIHLRLGDVVAGNETHEKLKRPLEIEYIKSLLVDDVNHKKYVIGKCFFAKPSSRNYGECIHLSNVYLHKVINELQAEHFDSGDADTDLCCAVQSKTFIQGRGYFSKLIVDIRKKLNLHTIETETETELL